jgi:catechol 2,3-dioxygenase-like lactoylglutathione lyase family enzyme
MKPKISIITLGVQDFKKSISFYRDGLGFPVESQQDDIVFFKLEGITLALYSKDKLAEDATVPNNGSGFSGITLAHCVASKEKVNETFAAVIKAGAKEIKKPQDVFWGGYSSYVADPDGYLWEIAWNPFADRT